MPEVIQLDTEISEQLEATYLTATSSSSAGCKLAALDLQAGRAPAVVVTRLRAH